MIITLNIELTEANLEKLKVFCDETDIKKAKSKVSKKTTAPKAAANTEAPDIGDTDTSEEAAANITLTDLRSVALRISKAGKADTLREIFGKFGAKALKDINESDYKALMEELVSVNV